MLFVTIRHDHRAWCHPMGFHGDIDVQSDSESIVANPSRIRPPIAYVAAILTGFALHYWWPVALSTGRWGIPVGLVLIALAITIFLLSLQQFRSAGTPVRGNQPTTTIVRSGPFRFSRNPIYMAFTLLQLGIAMVSASLWVLVAVVPAVALIRLSVIPREEHYLEAKFGEEYLKYRSSVRRWL